MDICIDLTVVPKQTSELLQEWICWLKFSVGIEQILGFIYEQIQALAFATRTSVQEFF